jgi:hypothetical protein
MRWLLVGAWLAGCQFRAGAAIGGDGSAAGSDAAHEMMPPEGPQANCAWSYTPTNFDPCMLPAPGMLASTGLTIDTDDLGDLPAMVSTQADGVALVVVHLSSLEISGAWTTTGSAALVLAVDGAVTIDAGATVAVSSDSDDPMACMATPSLTGNPGVMSTADGDGGGGGAGGAGAGASGKGGNGDGPSKGNGGAMVPGLPPPQLPMTAVSPLRGGCPGGGGGTDNGNGTPGVGGAGGGALQISSNTSIDVEGAIDAFGQGSTGTATSKTGAGGGGGGGAILLEAPAVALAATAVLCGDGGSGGDGGGTTSSGAPGTTSPCNATKGAHTTSTGNAGGAGGDGGFAKTPNGVNGTDAQGGGHAGGGGGGGGVGWIHFAGPHPATVDGAAVITPMQQ